jgi:hypothetical protein
MANEPKTYKRTIGIVLPGFSGRAAVETETYNGKRRARFTIRDILRDKLVTVTLWEGVVERKLPYLEPGALVVADGVYSARDKKNVKPGDDSKMHSISVSKSEGLWVSPSADSIAKSGMFIDDGEALPDDFDSGIGGDSDGF